MRHGARLFVFLAAMLATASPARADDPIYICAHAMVTQKMYHAMAWTTTGSKLNSVSHSSAYDPYANFLMIAWDQTHVTIVKMDGLFAAPTVIPTTGTDQDGNPWEISAYSSSTCP